LNDDNRYLPASHFYRLRQYEVRNQDLMISVVGTLGNVAICTEEDVPAMFSCKSTLFRSNEADPYFLLAYLNSAPGQLCMLRRQRGAIQAGLNMEDLRTIPVPRFGKETEEVIAATVRSAHRNLIVSRQKYEAAQQMLESELGLNKLTFLKPVGYIANFSEALISRRIDADYFQTPFRIN
jgi:type I restriction enzyme S subunit